MLIREVVAGPDDMVNSDAFRRWFAGSKCVDRAGRPLVVYHGTPDVRNLLQQGFRPSPHRGEVYFFSDNYQVANTYTDEHRAFDYQNAEPYTLPVYLALRNPLHVDGGGDRWRKTEHFVNMAREGGHDGVIISNSRDEYNNIAKNGGRVSTIYAVFSQNQIVPALRDNIISRVDKKDLGRGHPETFSRIPN